jgi:hypothetical protein
MSCSMCDPSGSRNPIGMARLHLRDTFPIAVLLLALIGLPGLAGAEWSAIAETKVLYTDNVFELSSSRRLALAEDPSQPAVVSVSKASDVVWEPSLDVRHRSRPTSLGETEVSIKASGFVFTENPIFTHGNYRIRADSIPVCAESFPRAQYGTPDRAAFAGRGAGHFAYLARTA